MIKRLIFSVDMRQCEMQVFRTGGPGGQKQNKTSSGVRIIHHPSGAIGESREERSQRQNKKLAFERMGKSAKFQQWAKQTALKLPSIDELVTEAMNDENLLIEYREGKNWRDSDNV